VLIVDMKEGKVIIQTYNPEHYAIEDVRKNDYLTFYEQEMTYRCKML
jgi:primosomal protein N' (replication factor Y)